MKRLLEWKQRMLQSPLNRKAYQNSNRMYFSRQEPYYKIQENEYSYKMPNVPFMSNGKSYSNIAQYNSYSSDDEGKFYYFHRVKEIFLLFL